MKKQLFGVLAIVVAISASAFTHIKAKPASDLVWFEVNASGNPLHPALGEQGDNPPAAYNCSTGSTRCARAYSIQEGEVTLNPDGITYTLNTSAANFNQERKKN